MFFFEKIQKDDVLDDSDLDEDALLYGSDDDNDDLKYSPSASTLGTVVDHQKLGDIADSHPGNTNSGISKTHVKMPLTPPATTHETGDTGNLAESVHGNTLSGDIHEATLASSEEVVNGEFESKRQGLTSGAMLMLKDTDKEVSYAICAASFNISHEFDSIFCNTVFPKINTQLVH